MKIIIFTENNHCGGMDTFYPTLINEWPFKDDEFVFICNKTHPGLENIIRSIRYQNCKVIAHDMPLNWVVSKKLFDWLPDLLCRATQPFLRILLLPIQVHLLKNYFKTLGGDRLLVVNGGYPGGESCRLANIVWAKLGNKKGVHNIRNFAINPRPGFGLYEKYMDRLLIKNTSSFVGVSKICAESLRIRNEFSNIANIYHIYNGLDLNKDNYDGDVNLRNIFKIPEDAPLCLMLATYELRKGYELLFNASNIVSEKYPKTHFVICGDGTDDEIKIVKALKDKISPDSNINLHGFIAGGRALIEQSDILLIASQEFESFGWTAIEGMLAKVPVVSTNVGGLPEVIGDDGYCGYCVPKDDIQGYAEKIIALISDPSLRITLGENGYKRVSTLFNAQRMVSEYAELVRNIN